MKKLDGYEFIYAEALMEFHFESIGPKGTIRKIVKFTFHGKNLCNLAFGDQIEGGFDDEVISDNGDMRKIIQTVVNITLFFSHLHPDCRIMIHPVDRKRKLLYNRIFQVFETAILQFYEVEGFLVQEKKREPFNGKKWYDAFVLYPIATIFGK
jgi:hypothetical protein